MRHRFAALVLLGFVVACGPGFADPIASHDVIITATKATSPNGENVALAIANHGTSTALVGNCGTEPLITVHEFINDHWIASSPGCEPLGELIPLAAGEELVVRRSFARGRYRFSVSVTTRVDRLDVAPATSNTLDIR